MPTIALSILETCSSFVFVFLKQGGRSSFLEGRLPVLAHGLSAELSQRSWVFHLSFSLAFLRWVMPEEASFLLRAPSF